MDIIQQFHYLSAGNGLFAIYEMNSTGKNRMYYIHADYLGSYQTITNEQGNVVEELSFGPCLPVRNAMEAGGRRRNPTDWTYNNVPTFHLFDRGYTGHEHLDNFDLINMNGRMYDPWLGRMLSPDNYVQAPTYSQNFNRYSYALNNPLKYTDPSGFTYKPSYWDDGNGGATDVNAAAWAYLASNQGYNGPGSGNHWSDYVRSEYGNYMLMSSNTFNNVYGEGSVDIAQKIISNPSELEKWQNGDITIEQVREDGGFWVNENRITPSTWHYYNIDGKRVAVIEGGVEIVSKWVEVGEAGGGKGFKNKLNTTGQIAALSGTSNAVKSQLFNFAERTSSIPLKNLNYVKGVNEIGIAGILFGMGVSGYNMYSDYSQFGTVNSWDVADFGVGVASLGATIFLVSNPVGWIIVGGGTVYFISRAIYDARTNE